MTVRIVLVDDQALLRSAFSLMLSVEDGLEVVGQAATGREALEEVARLGPDGVDVVLMDVQMPVMDGIEATAQIAAVSQTKVIILTTFDRDDYLFDALQAGASGFLLKTAEPEELVAAVRAVAAGHALLSPEVTLRVIRQLTAARSGVPHSTRRGATLGPEASGGGRAIDSRLARLTERELDVLRRLATGRSNAEIAADLFLAEPTVKTHVSNVLSKIDARDRVQAVIFAYRMGLAGD